MKSTTATTPKATTPPPAPDFSPDREANSEQLPVDVEVIEDAATLKTALAAERLLSDSWLDALQAMRSRNQLPEYHMQRLFPTPGGDLQYDGRREARARTNAIIQGDKAPPPHMTLGCSLVGRLSETTGWYYVTDGEGRVIAEGAPSDVCCAPGIAECLSSRQLCALALGLRHEAQLLNASMRV